MSNEQREGLGMASGQSQMMRVEEVAQVLNVTPAKIRRDMAEGRLEYVRLPGRSVRIQRDYLERLITENTVPAKTGGRR